MEGNTEYGRLKRSDEHSPGVAIPGVSPDTLYKYVGEQKIPAFKLGNRWRFKKSKLDEWMEEKSNQMETKGKKNRKQP